MKETWNWLVLFCVCSFGLEMVTGWFSAHFPSWFFQTVWGVSSFQLARFAERESLMEATAEAPGTKVSRKGDPRRSFQSRGDVYLIGPTWAGKQPWWLPPRDRKATSGIIEIEGKAPGHPQLKVSISYLPQENAIVQKLTVQELISFSPIYPHPFNGQWHRWVLCFTPEQKKWSASKSGGKSVSYPLCWPWLVVPVSYFWWANGCHGYVHCQRFRGDSSAFKGPRCTIIVYSSHYIEEAGIQLIGIFGLTSGTFASGIRHLSMRSEEANISLCHYATKV